MLKDNIIEDFLELKGLYAVRDLIQSKINQIEERIKSPQAKSKPKSDSRSNKMKRVWATMSPAERAERRKKMNDSRRKNAELRRKRFNAS